MKAHTLMIQPPVPQNRIGRLEEKIAIKPSRSPTKSGLLLLIQIYIKRPS